MKRLSLLYIFIGIFISVFSQGEYSYYIQKAKMGNAVAQNSIGLCYFNGFDVSQDYAQAVYWFKKAAEQGDLNAQVNLAWCYQKGLGVSQNYTQAVNWYKKAAEQGNASAQKSFGYCYFNGLGVSQDYAQAVYWYKKAAEQGNAGAQNDLGCCYQEGLGVTKDYTQAINWYKKSAEQGDLNAQVNLAWCYQNGLGVSQNYTQAVNWYKKAAEQGNVLAQNNIGYCYQEGLGVTKDYTQAVNWYKKAAEQGNASAQFNLGKLYSEWIDNGEDKTQAVYWFKKAAENGSIDGQLKLGTYYLYGVGVEADLKQAEYWIEKAAEKGNEEAIASLQVVKSRLKSLNNQLLQRHSSFNSIDLNIPSTNETNQNYFAVIIGNEKYLNEKDVPYAENDAKIFMEYLKQTIGVPEKQIKYVPNATLNGIRMAIKWLSQAMEVSSGKGYAYFYFAGHGLPDETTKTQLLLPVDGIATDPESAYSLEKLYSELGKMSAQRITVFLDACFSGATREGEMLTSSRGVAIKTKTTALQGNMIVFLAAQGDEASYYFKEQNHGLFTYFLLKKIQETQGDVSLGTLADYLQNEVKRQSFADNNKVQTPIVSASQSVGDNWKNLKLK